MSLKNSANTTGVIFYLLLATSYSLSFISTCYALAPKEIVVIANKNLPESVQLAHEYLKKRQIPQHNLLLLGMPKQETITRREYIPIHKAVQKFVKALQINNRIRCLVTMYGVPLRITATATNPADRVQLRRLQQERDTIKKQQTKEESEQSRKKRRTQITTQITQLKLKTTRAAVDSELALVLTADYPLGGWLKNPYYIGFKNTPTLLTKNTVLMVSRLDGPDPDIVRRIMSDAVQVEQTGLKGKAYLDARWKASNKKKLSGYALYDHSLHLAAGRLAKYPHFTKVQLDTQNSLFQPGEAPNAALYCGWYSLSTYVDAFSWKQGAVGYHIASGECTTLKKKNSQVWCKRMLEEGVSATLGPVFEPYIQAFPLPELFFTALSEGYLSLAETYLISLPYLSWQMVLIGDPLYQPFSPEQTDPAN